MPAVGTDEPRGGGVDPALQPSAAVTAAPGESAPTATALSGHRSARCTTSAARLSAAYPIAAAARNSGGLSATTTSARPVAQAVGGADAAKERWFASRRAKPRLAAA